MTWKTAEELERSGHYPEYTTYLEKSEKGTVPGGKQDLLLDQKRSAFKSTWV